MSQRRVTVSSDDDEATNFSRHRNPWSARESVTVPSSKLYVGPTRARPLVFSRARPLGPRPRPVHGNGKVGGIGSFLSEDGIVVRLSAVV
jgi:hypothetical protein